MEWVAVVLEALAVVRGWANYGLCNNEIRARTAAKKRTLYGL